MRRPSLPFLLAYISDITDTSCPGHSSDLSASLRLKLKLHRSRSKQKPQQSSNIQVPEDGNWMSNNHQPDRHVA